MDESPDPAAVFACAKSLHDACLARAESEPGLDLSEAYQGMDTFMREVMRVGKAFEDWACHHVAFDDLTDVWPYLLEDRFGEVCLETLNADSIGGFDSEDCLRIALRLRLPMGADGSLSLPISVEAPNPIAGAEFHRLRIQTIRRELDEVGDIATFAEGDDPFDENYGEPFFGVYGVRTDGRLEHIADRRTYHEARTLLTALLPGIDFPERVVAFSGSRI